jgi:thiamine biosynthesis lipoprotein
LAPKSRGSARAALRLEEASRITVIEPVWIDLGGIAKGAAVDAAVAAVRAGGAASAIVNAGGDIATFGPVAQPIIVRGPGGTSIDAGLLADGAIATSGPFGEASGSSLVLAQGRVARWADRSVSVVAPTCQIADALTKVLAVLGPDAAPLLARHAAQGFSIDAAGKLERLAMIGA